MKEIKNYICIVDGHRDARSQYMHPRSTAGRYRVGAKTEKEAEKLLREVIGFGSIKVYYETKPETHPSDGPPVKYKEVVKCVYGPEWKNGTRWIYEEPKHATAQRNEN